MTRLLGDPAAGALDLQAERTSSGAVLVRASGCLTLQTRVRLRWLLRAMTPRRGGDVRIDLSQVTEVDPAGLAVLLLQARSCRATGGRLLVLSPSPVVREALVKVGGSSLVADASW